MKTNLCHKLALNKRVKTCQAFKSQKGKKLNKTFELRECSQSFFMDPLSTI